MALYLLSFKTRGRGDLIVGVREGCGEGRLPPKSLGCLDYNNSIAFWVETGLKCECCGISREQRKFCLRKISCTYVLISSPSSTLSQREARCKFSIRRAYLKSIRIQALLFGTIPRFEDEARNGQNASVTPMLLTRSYRHMTLSDLGY